MHLVASRLYRVTRPPARPSVWLVLTDDLGRTGLGEASPLPPFSPDDIDACERALAAVHERVAPLDDDAPASDVARAPLALANTPSARFALETALLDLLAQRRGVSLAELLGGPRPYREVAVNGLLFADPPEGLAERALALAAEGLSAVKIKLRARDDAGFARELAALHALRRAFPLPFELRLDPNAAWSLREARERLTALAPIAPRYVEQPVAPDQLLQLGACGVPWAADESLALPGVADALLDAGVCAAFILKPAVIGGLLAARSLAVRAMERGLGVVVTHLFDGPIAIAAACELSLSLPAPPLACGLDPHERAASWPWLPVPQTARRGFVIPADRPGLGVSLPTGDPEWMR